MDKLIKENAYGNKDKPVLIKLKGMIAQFTEDGLLNLEEYTNLFPREDTHHLSIEKNGFKWIWFYINHEGIRNDKPRGGDKLFTHPKIRTFAKDIFDYYEKEKGIKYIKKKLIDAFRNDTVTTSDLQRWFGNLTEIKDGYTNEDWDNLCRDENGNNVTYEVKFQLRLEIANLYKLALSEMKVKIEREIRK